MKKAFAVAILFHTKHLVKNRTLLCRHDIAFRLTGSQQAFLLVEAKLFLTPNFTCSISFHSLVLIARLMQMCLIKTGVTLADQHGPSVCQQCCYGGDCS